METYLDPIQQHNYTLVRLNTPYPPPPSPPPTHPVMQLSDALEDEVVHFITKDDDIHTGVTHQTVVRQEW